MIINSKSFSNNALMQKRLLRRRTRLCFVQNRYASFYETLPIEKAFLEEETEIDDIYLKKLQESYKKHKKLIYQTIHEACNIKPFHDCDHLFQATLISCCADFLLRNTDKILLIAEYLIIANGFFSDKECKLMNGILNYALSQLNERI